MKLYDEDMEGQGGLGPQLIHSVLFQKQAIHIRVPPDETQMLLKSCGSYG